MTELIPGRVPGILRPSDANDSLPISQIKKNGEKNWRGLFGAIASVLRPLAPDQFNLENQHLVGLDRGR